MLRQVATMPEVAAVVGPYGPRGAAQVSRDGRTAYATVDFVCRRCQLWFTVPGRAQPGGVRGTLPQSIGGKGTQPPSAEGLAGAAVKDEASGSGEEGPRRHQLPRSAGASEWITSVVRPPPPTAVR